MPDTTVTPTGSVVCPDGCCLEVEDPSLSRPPNRDRYARPMFEVLASVVTDPDVSVGAMRITSDDYRPDGLLL